MMDSIKNIAFKTEFYEPLGIYLYSFNKKDLLGLSEIYRKLLIYCDFVQDSVWEKRFDGHSGVELDGFLLLAWDDQKNIPVAFFSCGFFPEEKYCFLYHYEGMILPGYRGKGLLRRYIADVARLANEKWDNLEVINIMATGYLPVFKVFETSKEFTRLPWPCDEEIIARVWAIIGADFQGGTMTEDGVIRGVWRRQHNGMVNVWPLELREQFGFPDSVNYFDGDVLIRLYLYDSRGVN